MKLLKQLILAVTLLISASAASAQVSADCSTNIGITTCQYNIPDDGYAIVPIPFPTGFPFYGRVFTHSLFFDNGVVSFYSPTDPMRTGGQTFNAQPLGDNIGPNFYYSIMPLWTDLRNYSGRYFTETDGQGFLRYNWENISQWGHPDRLNTFSLEIQPSGYIGLQYQQVNISGYAVTIGTVGDASLGEYSQFYRQDTGGSTNLDSLSSIPELEITGLNCSNPLNDSRCPGYDVAYFNQQCSISALYSPACPGYATAYTLTYLINVDTVNSTTVFEPVFTQESTSVIETLNIQESNPAIVEILTVQEAVSSVESTVVQETVNVRETDLTALQDLVIAQLLADQTSSTDVEVDLTEDKENEMSLESLLSSPTPTPQPTSTATSSSRETANAAPTTTRQAIAQQRQAAAREQAAQEARDDPEGTAEAMDSAESMEQQIEIQNAVLGAMSFVPGFDAYGRITLPDAVGYAPFEIYSGQRNIDTPAARGLLGRSDRLHQEMVNEQWNR